MLIPLSLSNLARLDASVGRPAYARRDLSAGIVHFGVGNFHRAHQATYLDDLFNLGRDHDWAIVGAGVMPGDKVAREKLTNQDWLTTVVEQSASTFQARVIGSMIGFLPVGDVTTCVSSLADPAIKIVSLTVTEGGYFIDPASGVFDADHPTIRADATHSEAPKTVFGLILAALKARRAAGTRPFTVMSCDNVPGNGEVTKAAVAGLADLTDPSLASWIRNEVAFPNAMVDRITLATGDRERSFARDNLGIEDAAPVFCEDFRQWVLEDRFPAGRPALEEVGVTFVDDVDPYEMMKIRLLNGGHAVIAYPAGLMDIHFVHEAMENDLIRAFLSKVETEEIIPTVPPVPGTDFGDYHRLIQKRFANPRVEDTIRRLCLDGSNRQPKFIIPTILDRLRHGLGITGLALESALWCRYCFGVTETGLAIEPNDPNWSRLTRVARAAKNDPMAWLGMDDIYGETAQAEPFRRCFAEALRDLWADGTPAVLQRYLSGVA